MTIKIKDKENKILITLQINNLSGANLRGANLSGANLRGANLSGANLSDAILPKTDIIINDKYHIHIRPDDYIKIGCENHSFSWWKKLSFKKAELLDNGAGKWWEQWKPVVLAIHESIKDREVKTHA